MKARKEYLKPEQLRELFAYDPEAGVLTWKERSAHWFKDGYRTAQGEANNWNTRYSGKPAGYVAPVGYRYVGLPGPHRVPEHRVIWAMVYGEWPETIDHINGNKLDNRLRNLRNVTQAVNLKNAAKWSHNTSGVTGVCWDRRAGRWMASIKVGQKSIFLCHSDNLEDAALARKNAEARYGFTDRHGV